MASEEDVNDAANETEADGDGEVAPTKGKKGIVIIGAVALLAIIGLGVAFSGILDSDEAEEEVAVVESVKAASDIYAPIAGEVVAVNDDVVNSPESINADAYANWLFKIKPADVSALDGLLDAAAYGATTSA